MTQLRILFGVLLALAALPEVAFGAQAARLSVQFEPNRPGASTTLAFDFAIDTPALLAPSPLVKVDLQMPTDLAYDTSTLGLASCSAASLARRGAAGCPAESRVGFGRVTVALPLGPALLTEQAGMTTFVGRSEGGRTELLYYATGIKPVIAQFMLAGELLSEAAGERIETSIPLITTLPEATNVSIIDFYSTIGPRHLYYYRQARGKRIRYHPRGILLPAICPHGGFHFSASFSFQDGTSTTAHSTVPCLRP
jgi:hypothetical protein